MEAPGQISRWSHPFPFTTICPPSALSRSVLLIHPFPFTSFPSLPFPPSYSKPFPSPIAIAPPAGPGGARSPNAFLCNSQLKFCKSVKTFTHCNRKTILNNFLPETREPPGLCPFSRPYCHATVYLYYSVGNGQPMQGTKHSANCMGALLFCVCAV